MVTSPNRSPETREILRPKRHAHRRLDAGSRFSRHFAASDVWPTRRLRLAGVGARGVEDTKRYQTIPKRFETRAADRGRRRAPTRPPVPNDRSDSLSLSRFQERFGLWTVQTTRAVRVSVEHAPSSQSLDTSLTHSEKPTEFSTELRWPTPFRSRRWPRLRAPHSDSSTSLSETTRADTRRHATEPSRTVFLHHSEKKKRAPGLAPLALRLQRRTAPAPALGPRAVSKHTRKRGDFYLETRETPVKRSFPSRFWPTVLFWSAAVRARALLERDRKSFHRVSRLETTTRSLHQTSFNFLRGNFCGL